MALPNGRGGGWAQDGGEAVFGALAALVGGVHADPETGGHLRQWAAVDAGGGDQFQVGRGQAPPAASQARGGGVQARLQPGVPVRPGRVRLRSGVDRPGAGLVAAVPRGGVADRGVDQPPGDIPPTGVDRGQPGEEPDH